jgi:hypothetical protein
MSEDKMEHVKNQIHELSLMHAKLNDHVDNMAFAEQYEIQAEMIILEYCINKKYLVHGFAPQVLVDDEDVEDMGVYLEKLRLYLDILCIGEDDVAELCFYYQSIFWPDFSESKEEMIARINKQVDSGKFYE